MQKCNLCGTENTEVTVKQFTPVSISDWVAKICTFGTFKLVICQTCTSRIFRKLDKDL